MHLHEFAAKQRKAKWSTRGNVRTEVDGIKFASKAEARRYRQLKLSQMAGNIDRLECHPRLSLDVEGQHVCIYTPDFAYSLPRDSKRIYDDVKGKLEEAAWVRIRLARVLGFEVRLLTKQTNPELWRSK